MKHANKSTTPSLFESGLVSIHIATSTTSLKKGFPPPICHKLVGFAAITVTGKSDPIFSLTKVAADDEKRLLNVVDSVTQDRDVVNFVPHRFTLPVLRGAAYRTGTPFTPLDPVWFDMSAWFGNGKTTMSDCAIATGLAQRHPLDISLALKDERLRDIEDQLLIDAFMTLCMRLRQLVVEDPRFDVETCRKIVSKARKHVRAVVKEPACKQYVSWKGMLDKKLFLLK